MTATASSLSLGRLLMAALAILIAICAVSVNAATSIEEKITELNSQAAKFRNKPIPLETKSYNQLTTGPRNYSLFVELTALGDRFNCIACRDFKPEYELVVQGWSKKGEAGRAFFAVLDFEAGQELKINTVPYIFHFPPNEGPNKKVISGDYEVYDLNRITCWSYIVFVFTNRRLWTVASLGLTIMFCSGYMWNNIRGAPYTGGRDGREIFAPGFQSQYVIETQITSVLYALSSVFFVALASHIPQIKNAGFQRLAVYLGIGGFLFIYSIQLRVFKYKNGGYPFTWGIKGRRLV
ncbi:oligosaccharyl transferase subunit ost3/OST6 [Blyttiomyces sp. JEL0837]|nr:oligosaccharyl transferase subunit ost3/OST6 [Blyttiomyces sp. JEL0837]